MKTRNVRIRQCFRYYQYLRRLDTECLIKVPTSLRRRQLQDQFQWRSKFERTLKLQAFWRNELFKEMRQISIADYEADPGGWWLKEAKRQALNFFIYCEDQEKRWGPNGTEHKWRRRLKIDRQQVASYYDSESYKQMRRANGT